MDAAYAGAKLVYALITIIGGVHYDSGLTSATVADCISDAHQHRGAFEAGLNTAGAGAAPFFHPETPRFACIVRRVPSEIPPPPPGFVIVK